MARRSWAFDIALAVVVGAAGQLEAWWGVGATHRQGPLWAQALLYGVSAALLVVRRVSPLGCQAAILAVSVAVFLAYGAPEGNGVALPSAIAAYTVGRLVEARRAWWSLVLAAAYWAAWSGLDPLNEGASAVERLGTVVWLSPIVIAWLVGVLLRLSTVNREQRRAGLLQREAQAVAQERNRIARELHDVVGHSVSVMTVQASAVRRRLTPDQAVEREALEAVEVTGRAAMAEMRRLVGVLRDSDDGTDLMPAPGLARLDDLVEQVRAAGLEVSVSVTGTPRALAPGLDLTAYRLVQEGLTNTLRHARDAHGADVSIRYGADHVEVAVRDDGRATSEQTAEPGIGLVGMRERVELYGGSLVSGPCAPGGFALVATLPTGPT